MSETLAPEGWPNDATGVVWSRYGSSYPILATDDDSALWGLTEMALWFWTEDEDE